VAGWLGHWTSHFDVGGSNLPGVKNIFFFFSFENPKNTLKKVNFTLI